MNLNRRIAVVIGALRSSALLTAGIVAMILIAAPAAAAEKTPLELVRTISSLPAQHFSITTLAVAGLDDL